MEKVFNNYVVLASEMLPAIDLEFFFYDRAKLLMYVKNADRAKLLMYVKKCYC